MFILIAISFAKKNLFLFLSVVSSFIFQWILTSSIVFMNTQLFLNLKKSFSKYFCPFWSFLYSCLCRASTMPLDSIRLPHPLFLVPAPDQRPALGRLCKSRFFLVINIRYKFLAFPIFILPCRNRRSLCTFCRRLG